MDNITDLSLQINGRAKVVCDKITVLLKQGRRQENMLGSKDQSKIADKSNNAIRRGISKDF